MAEACASCKEKDDLIHELRKRFLLMCEEQENVTAQRLESAKKSDQLINELKDDLVSLKQSMMTSLSTAFEDARYVAPTRDTAYSSFNFVTGKMVCPRGLAMCSVTDDPAESVHLHCKYCSCARPHVFRSEAELREHEIGHYF